MQKNMSGCGALVLVVGPSGSGKDTLIGLAREQLKADAQYVFPRRVITRIAQIDAEDHDTMDVADFERAEAAGQFALSVKSSAPASAAWRHTSGKRRS